MKKTISIFVLLFSLFSSFAQKNYIFKEGYINSIKPKGWVNEFLERQRSGLTGHPEAMAYPYNTCLWAGDIKRNRDYGQDWWRYEQTAYYTDGLLRLGYLLSDTALINKGEAGIKYTIDHAAQNGRLGNPVISSLWPMVVFSRAMIASQQYNGDDNIVKALEKHYLSLSTKDLTKGRRHILNIEGMLWVYGLTKNEALLSLAKEAYEIGGFELDAKIAESDDYIHMHGVTYAEMLKVPLLLYAYSGEKRYLDIALNAERKLERDHMLPDGVYTSAEFTEGKDIDIAHETCDITDYTWSLGYFLTVTGESRWADMIEKAIFNAGLGSITKDFKALQYFSSVNQVIATGDSDFNKFKKGSTWMAFRPTHETECCAGNVNRFMPNYVSRMWLREPNGGVVAALYGPSTFLFKNNGTSCSIEEDTNYPFEGEITFNFKMDQEAEFPFVFRVPGWCKNLIIKVNGKTIEMPKVDKGFCRITRIFKDGDKVCLKMDMPVEINDANGQGIYFSRGPLLLSYAVPQQKVEDTKVYENMNGKVSSNPDFKCWSITPTAKFGYAISSKDIINGKSIKAKTKKSKIKQNEYPFDLKDAPIKVKIPVSEFDWQLLEGRYNPTLPSADTIKVTGKTKISLVPYGCTELRLTVFPYIKQ